MEDISAKFIEEIAQVLNAEKAFDNEGVSYFVTSNNIAICISNHKISFNFWMQNNLHKKENKYSIIIENCKTEDKPYDDVNDFFIVKEYRHILKNPSKENVLKIANAINLMLVTEREYSNPFNAQSKYLVPSSQKKIDNKDFLAFHFAGLFDTATIEVKKAYEKSVDFYADKNCIDSFNKNATLIYESSLNYDNSKLLLKYINTNNINSINISENMPHINNVDKILNFKKILDENYNNLNEYLLFIDSGDVVLNLNMTFDKILNAFKSYHCKVLFNQDYEDFPYCFSDVWGPGSWRYYEEYYSTPNIENLSKISNKHYLNSGIYFGKKEDIKTLLNRCYDFYEMYKDRNYDSDQFIFKNVTKIINDEYKYHFVEVDYNQILFMCNDKLYYE